MICHFLEQPTYDNLQRSVQTIDSEVKLCKDLDTSQVECIQYLIRDWGFQHIQEQMTLKQKKELFTINGKKQASGHFIKAIDYAKRNPKDNLIIMKFGLTLLIHSALDSLVTKPKIEALEQLLSSVHDNNTSETYIYTKNIKYLILLNGCLLLFILLNLKYV